MLKFGGTEPVAVDPGWPLKFRGAAGLYSLTAEVGGPAPRSGFKLLSAAPPLCKDEVQVP